MSYLNFWWIRHAPVINNNQCCYGDNEVDCDVTNFEVFNNLVKALPQNAFVYSSPLSRAKKTFLATAKAGLNYSSFSLDTRLKEQNIGVFAGMKYNELYKLTKKLNIYSPHWLMHEKYTPSGGESFVDLNSRVNQFLNERIKDRNKKEIIIFSHGGPIRSALNIALNNKEVSVGTFKIENLKVTKIIYLKGNWQIDYVNK